MAKEFDSELGEGQAGKAIMGQFILNTYICKIIIIDGFCQIYPACQVTFLFQHSDMFRMGNGKRMSPHYLKCVYHR